MMIGAAGCVDLIGARGILRIVLLDKGQPATRTRIEIGRKPEEETGWHPVQSIKISERGRYIATLPPRITATALSADAFRDALMELSDVQTRFFFLRDIQGWLLRAVILQLFGAGVSPMLI